MTLYFYFELPLYEFGSKRGKRFFATSIRTRVLLLNLACYWRVHIVRNIKPLNKCPNERMPFLKKEGNKTLENQQCIFSLFQVIRDGVKQADLSEVAKLFNLHGGPGEESES